MDGVRTAEGGEGVYRRDDPGSNLGRREVGGRSAGAFGGTDGGLTVAVASEMAG